MTPANLQLLAAAALVLATGAGRAHAQDACFTVPGTTSERAQHLVGLDDVVRLDAGCEYALAADGPWTAPGALAGRDTDFAEIHRQLASAPGVSESGDPRVVLARRTGRRTEVARQQSLMLRYCAHYLLEEQLGFRVVPRGGGGGFRIERVPAAGCDAENLELRAVPGARSERLSAASPEQTLGLRQPSLELPEGDWSIYAARPGSGAALRIGVFRSQRVVTPLQNHLRTVGLEPSDAAGGRAPALLAARWDPAQPGLLLHPTEHATGQALLWPELRTAADAGLLWVARPADEGPPRVVGLVQLEATDPAAVRLPDTAVREYMRERYGEAGDALVPTTEDWTAIFDRLAFCLTPSYLDPRAASIGDPVPDPGACAALGGLAIFAQSRAAEATPARYCVRHGMQVIRADGVSQELGEPECFALPEPGSASRPPFAVAVAGDRVTVEGDGLCVLIDDRAIEPNDEGEHVLTSGLLEIRQGGGPDCTARQAVARLRMPVIDPEREWHPVGLYTGASEEAMQCGDEGDAVCPWRALPHDERTVFGFVEPRQELAFRLSTSPQVAAVMNADPTRDVQVTHDVPVLAGVSGRFEGPREAAVVAYVSREPECPADVPYGDLRERPPVDVDALLPDSTFHVLLLSVAGLDEPPACLARASFRIRPSRAFVAETVADFLGLELGVLGDTQAVFFANTPVALGVALPLVWFRLTPGQRWISFEVAGNLVMSAAFDPAALSRVGVSLSWALQLGIPEYVPRLLSVGGMLHGAADTRAVDGVTGMPLYDQPIVSFFVGLNLSTLIDLAGGR